MANEKELRDSWGTPDDFWKAFERGFVLQPTLDVCASEENTKLPYYFGPEQDAMSIDWVGSAKDAGLAPVFWCNPGYSNVTPWVQAAIEAAGQGGTTYLLTHDNYNSAWFRTLWENDACLYTILLQPRIRFIPAPGIKQSSPRGNNMLHVITGQSSIGRKNRIVPMNWKAW